MAISTVVVRGGFALVYDERGQQICTVGLNSGDSLQGYTSNSLTIKRGNALIIYDEKGRQIKVI